MRLLKEKILISLLFLMGFSVYGQDIPEDIEKSIRVGNATELANYFNEHIELTVDKKEEVYSKSQALVIMKNFFTNNKPQKFHIMHKGGEASKFFVTGNLTTGNKSFRVILFLKEKGNTILIHQLTIEEDNE